MTDTVAADSEAPVDASPAEPDSAPAEEIGWYPTRVGTLVAVIALMAILGGWELLLMVFAVAVFIIIHELGHYALARWSGMKVTEYFIGFGPRIFAVKRGETSYGLKALPFGAYVRIIGMNNLDEVDPGDENRAYRSKSWHKRFLTTAAGPATHFVLAVLLAAFAIWQFGEAVEDEWEVSVVVPFSAAADAGVERGDRIVGLGGQDSSDFDQLRDIVQPVRGEVVEIDIIRDGRPLTLEARIGERLTATGSRGYSGLYEGDLVLGLDGQPVANYAEFAALARQRIGDQVEVDVVYNGGRHTELVTVNDVVTENAVVGFLGVGEGTVRTPLPLTDALIEAPQTVAAITRDISVAVGELFTSGDGWRALFALPAENDGEPATVTVVDDPEQIRPLPELDENRLLSIVGAVDIATQLVDDGAAAVAFFFVGLNISLGLLNLIPLLPFDGGHMLVASYERVRSFGGRQHRVDAAKLLPLTYAVVAFMLLVGGIAILRDVFDPIELPR